jgi:hypothetical protein
MAPDGAERFQRVMDSYYKNPDPLEAAYALAFLLENTELWREDSPQAPMTMYYFCRIAQRSPEAIPAFEGLRAGLGEGQAAFVRRLLLGSQRGQHQLPGPLDAPADSPGHLDWCWSEFLVSGDLAAVRHIVQALDKSDLLRVRLEGWYAEEAQRQRPGLLRRLFSPAPQLEATRQALEGVGIRFDRATGRLQNEEDMDCYCFRLAERKIPIFRLLPFQLSPEEVGNLGVKGSALWSLLSNARQHELVARCCREEAQKPGGRGRAYLQEVG